MDKSVVMFPGQSSQYVGMGKYWFDNYEIVRQRFEEVSEILGLDLASLCFNGPANELKKTENTQVALLTLSVAMYEVLLEEEKIKPAFLAGHSIGELSALTASGVFTFADGVHLARVRGEAMAACNTDKQVGMVAVTNIKASIVESYIAETDPKGVNIQIANFNSPTQTVLSSITEEMLKIGEHLKGLGANVIPLNVSGAFHSEFMADAQGPLAQALEPIILGDMSVPVMCGQDGRLYTKEDDIKGFLVSQLTQPVRWTKTLSRLSEERIDNWLEIGPKSVLKNLTLQTIPEARVYAYDEEADRNARKSEYELKEKDNSKLPNFVGLCLGAAVATRNMNWNEDEYKKGVIEPYKRIQKVHDLIEQEKRSPKKEELLHALSDLKIIFKTKGVPEQEQNERIKQISHSTSIESLIMEDLQLVREGG
ncbi:ACP S-malonyltransferase [Oceanobacillus manasiensis]|uniref:ACP S-malonyltransferase n=1 Tax=Oceanobacillus manasiensis TaxID=586413 RepID=UPI0005AAF5C3|nr:ACP S-malonyltransferase [Oceanobacillus manasiensis]